MSRDLYFSLRLAWREGRGSFKGLGVFLACLALGVAAITTVGTLSASVRESLRADARKLLGGDLELRQIYRPIGEDARRFLRGRARVAELAKVRVMARSAAGVTTLAELKAVDGAYPLFGELTLEGGGRPDRALARKGGVHGALADPRLLERLSAKVGDRIRVGAADYRINGIIAREPDKPTDRFALGPRLMVALESLPQTRIIQPGSLIYYVYKIGITDPLQTNALKEELRASFPQADWRVRDFAAATGFLHRLLGNLTLYLTFISLTALLVGGIGVAGAVSSYLEGRNLSIAAMKCLGADRRLIVSVYLIQTLGLALAGSALGVGIGLAASAGLAALLPERLGVTVKAGLFAGPILMAVAYGMLTALAFSLCPLSGAGGVSPSRLFRGYTDYSPKTPTPRAVIATAAALLGLFLLTYAFTPDKRIAWGFAGAFVASALLFRIFASGIMKGAALLPRPRNPRLRHALTSLHRPGASTPSVVYSLGLGLTVLAAVTLVDQNLQAQVRDQIPRAAPSYFFLDIQRAQIASFMKNARSLEGVSKLESHPSIRGRIVKLNGVPVEKADIAPGVRWVYRGDRGLTYASRLPRGSRITAGAWWKEDYRGPPLISFDERIARGSGVGVGDTLTLRILGREITARIASLREIDWTSYRLNHTIVFAPGTLESAPHTFVAAVFATKEAEHSLFQSTTRRFPNIVAIYTRDVLQEVSEVLEQISLALGGTALVTLLAGFLVLAETLRANLKNRHYHAVIFKVVGATRWDVLFSLAAEFLLLGAATALLAALLGTAIAYGFVNWIIRAPWEFQLLPVAVIAGGGVLVTLALGMAGVRGALNRKAWPLLRNE